MDKPGKSREEFLEEQEIILRNIGWGDAAIRIMLPLLTKGYDAGRESRSAEVEKLQEQFNRARSLMEGHLPVMQAAETKLAEQAAEIARLLRLFEKVKRASGHGSVGACRMWAKEALAPQENEEKK